MFASAYSRIRNHRGPAAIAALAMLHGCATPSGVMLPPLDDWHTRQQVLGAVRDWSFSGRLAVSDGEDGFNGKLRWRQERQHFAAELSGPLGAGRVEISGNGRRVTVTEKDGSVTVLANAERDLRARYGWSIPVASLRYWALGIPDPALPAAAGFGDDGLLRTLAQGGWQVTIDEYRDGGGQPMPRRMTALNAGTRVRLVIDHWVFR